MNEMGLTFLRWLQERRTPAIEDFFLGVTHGGEGFWILAVAGTLFWLFGARIGYRVGFALAAGDLLTGALKSTICLPRPWMRDPAIVPSPDAQWGAFGYSFPSGHTANTALLWGGLAAAARKGWLWIPALLWIGLVAFSRMVLGVHTPVDVAGSLVLAIPVVWLMGRIYDWTERNPSRAWMILLGAALAAAAAWVFVRYKPMPPDADPGFSRDAFRSVWGLLGFFGAWFVERKYVRFDPARLGGYRVVAVAVGVLVLSLMIGHLPRLLAPFLGAAGGSYAAAAANPVWIFVAWPYLLKGLEAPEPR
ncbi:MAG: phosphatase PAP2 family protein [Kiritimatiellia bacterium]